MGEVEQPSSANSPPEQSPVDDFSTHPNTPKSTKHDLGSGAEQADLTDQQIGRYLIKRMLGKGGIATVYQAFDQVLGQSVALKVLPPTADEKTLVRFRREAMTSGALRHPHIVRTIQVGVSPQGDVAYIAMELIEGESLGDLLARSGRLHPEESASVLEPIVSALAHAHKAGIVHRDVKPSNILLRPAAHGDKNSVQLESLEYPVVPMLSDFGIARSLDSPELTNQGRTVGTPAYMAPEQCTGQREIDGRADIYAVGAVLYRCIAGHPPFTGTTPQILHAHVYEPLTIEDDVLRHLPPVVIDILRQSLAKLPSERYSDAQAMVAELAIATGRPLSLPTDTSDEEPAATATMTSIPASMVEPEPIPKTVLIPGSGIRSSARSDGSKRAKPQIQQRRDRNPITSSSRTPPSVQSIANPAQQTFWQRLELFSWGSLAIVAVAAMLGAAIAAIFVSNYLRQIEPTTNNGALDSTVVPTADTTASPLTIIAVTGTLTVTATVDLSATETAEFTSEPTATETATATPFPTVTATSTATEPPTSTPPPTATETPIVIPTATWSPTPEALASPTATPSPQQTATPDVTVAPTGTPPTPTWTPPAAEDRAAG